MLIVIMKRDEYKWVYTNIKVWMQLRVDLNEKKNNIAVGAASQCY